MKRTQPSSCLRGPSLSAIALGMPLLGLLASGGCTPDGSGGASEATGGMRATGGQGGSSGGSSGSGGASQTGGAGTPSGGTGGGGAGTGGAGSPSGGAGGGTVAGTGGAMESTGGGGGSVDVASGETNGETAGPGPTPGTGPSDAPQPSGACAQGMTGPTGNQMIMGNGKNRSFIIRMPTGYDGKKPWPVLFAFHGAGGGASGFETGQFGGVSRMATDKAIRIYPQAFGGNTWSRDENDDVLYMDALVKWLDEKVCYDKARVFSAGHSSGAYFSHRWACDRPGLLRAVATSSGGQRRERALDCKSPVSAWTSTGAADNPGHVMGTKQARDAWGKLAGCNMTAMPTMVAPAPCVALTGCRPGYAVHYCQHGGGHAFPAYGSAGIVNFLFPDKP